MTDKKVSSLPNLPGGQLASGDLLYVARNGVSYNIDGENIVPFGPAGIEWTSYGNPSWRHDLRSSIPSELVNWTGDVADVSFSEFGSFLNRGAVGGAAVGFRRTVSGNPFVCDLRITTTEPGDWANASLGISIHGTTDTTRIYSFNFQPPATTGAPNIALQRFNPTFLDNTFLTSMGNLFGSSQGGDWTLRTLYDGTGYYFYVLRSSPFAHYRLASWTVTAASWLGTPTHVGVRFSAGRRQRAVFIQYTEDVADLLAFSF
jgi:hypothetical protein